MNQNENLQEMLKSLNNGNSQSSKINTEKKEEIKEDEKPDVVQSTTEIGITNFYNWYEAYASQMSGISQIRTEVTSINTKDSMIFKIPKPGSDIMELVSFYKPTLRPILNLPPIRLKVFKNDTFEAIHSYNENIVIKSYGVKTGLIVVYCAIVDGKIIPFEKLKIKKNVTSIKSPDYNIGVVNAIKSILQEEVDVEAIQLLYKQAIKFSDEFTTKESTIDWFLKKQQEVVDINHLIKIDNVLIHVI